jgi:4-amino-4-deoxy-L-arabinose transferase-like glycosyltransferase
LQANEKRGRIAFIHQRRNDLAFLPQEVTERQGIFKLMRSTLSKQEINVGNRAHNKLLSLRSCLLAWEICPIILVAGFLRLYRLDTAAFSGDQSTLFLLAYNAVHHGLIPATSNGASILIMNPPATVYFLMFPALFSPDPLWAVIMTALFNVIAILITYIFTRRYYGRLAATIAALLYATAGTPIVFSRFIWQPNLLAPFVILYLFALFWGVVERRQGWLFPALFLLGVMYQLHGLTLLLVVPLLVAILLAPKTIRLRDLILALICLLLIFTPYLIWEVSSGFVDLHTVFSLARTHARIDTQALTFYERLLRSYYYDERFLPSSYYDPARGAAFYDPIGSAFSLVFKLLLLLSWSHRILIMLLLGGLITAGIIIVRSPTTSSHVEPIEPSVKKPTSSFFPLDRLHSWWSNLRNNPARCGLVVLLAWQIVPPLLLARHTTSIHQHYLLLTIPGLFILIGFFITHLLLWFRQRGAAFFWQGTRYVTYAVTALILSIQLMGSIAALTDTVNGVNSHVFGYNDLGSLQHALHEADQVAQQHHFNRVYITISSSDDSLTGLPFLAEQMRTSTTLFDPTRCLVLPGREAGPAVLLMRSTDSLASSLLRRFATAILIDQPPLLGTSPFQLYIVAPTPNAHVAPTRDSFVNHLQLLFPYPQSLNLATSSFLVTSWTLLRNEQPGSRTSYTYMMNAITNLPGAGSIHSDCMLTSIRAGDQLLTTFRLPQNSLMPPSLKITSQFLMSSPYNITLASLHFETANIRGMPVTLQTIDRSGTITLYSPTM